MEVLVMLAAVLLVGSRTVGALSISHWDLEGANKTCEGKSSCEGVPGAEEVDWMERNCMCDEDCRRYGDCCPDAKGFAVDEQRRGSVSFTCKELREYGGVYMVASCPPEWGGGAWARAACEEPSPDDPVASLPATSPASHTTYANAHCALCHGETELEIWHPRIECPALPPDSIAPENLTLQYDHTEQLWGVVDGDEWFGCSVDPVMPKDWGAGVRRCPHNVVRTCAPGWANPDLRARCEAYTSLVYQGTEAYRNPHCAICNSVALQYLQCTRSHIRTFHIKDFSPAAFAVLFDLSGPGPVGTKRPCQEHELFDPFFGRCRPLLEELTRPPYHVPPTFSSDLVELVLNRTEPCPKFLLEREDYIPAGNSVYVPRYRKSFQPDEYFIRDDGALEVCVDSVGVKVVDKFGVYMGYVTYAGLGVSIIFLILHLTAFSLVSELRNLSGKNLASMCFALLVAYTSFMAGQVLEGLACFAASLLTYYSFLAAFAWCLTMGFDVWRTLRLATSELRVSAGKQWRKFAIYSVWSWGAPAVLCAGAFLADTAPPGPAWRPGFAEQSCWFANRRALWLFFATPLIVVMLFNVVFFGASAHMIYSTGSTTRFTSSAATQRDFRLYARLALLMGLTWSVGLAAGTLDIDSLWYLFVGLNTLQGLFVFLAFTCTDKVIRALALRRADSKPLRPPSFSWSSDSTHKSQMGSDHGTTDTLY